MIREATELDLEALELIENECFLDPYKKEQLLYELNENPVNKILLLIEDDKIIGFIDYMVTFNSATITQIGVLSSYRRGGRGSLLMDAMLDSLPSVNDYDSEDDSIVETITLEVRVSNAPAINFYHKYGFEDVVIKKNYYRDGEDAIYMMKRI